MSLDIASRFQKIELALNEAERVHLFRASLVAVTKLQPVEKIVELYHLGQRDFGENYVQEFLEKEQQLQDYDCKDIRWHFIGHLQTNKVKQLVGKISCLHTLETTKQAKEIQKYWSSCSSPLDCFIQVNIDEEATKSGIALSEIETFWEEARAFSALKIRGLMCIPHPDKAEASFSKLAQTSKVLQARFGAVELSMGMSDDYLSALRWGSNFIRLGTSLFGPREPSHRPA